ncbi:hypothetical protein EES41_14625 [Streptomyces sp. ADI95-16]|nr:S8 family serine peptidase [Streptomyces sp. ADI95-16]AYV27958.1 hypothetical protein EES41_14625 [Streptomyces sp. ADI95-16]
MTSCIGGSTLCNTHGTSSASALASASAALLWSAHPDWTNNQVLRVLLNTAGKPKDGAKRNDYIGYGVVRPRVAVPNPGDPGPANEFPLPDLTAVEASAAADVKAPESGKPVAVPQAEEAEEGVGGRLFWVALGLGVCVVVGGAVGTVVRRRRGA